MAQPEAALQAQLATWFAGVDPSMQQVLQTIYAEAPAAVSKAISGGAWVAAEGDPPLEEVLGGGMAGGFLLSNYTVDPWPITAGATAKVTLAFMSTAGQPGFRTEVKIVAPDGNETNQTLNGDALAPGGEATQEFTIENALEGNYQIDIDVNPDGAPPGEPPNDNGSQILLPGMGFEVMSAEGGAQAQDDIALSQGAAFFAALTTSPTWEEARNTMPEGLNYLASIDGLSGEESATLASLGSRVPSEDPTPPAVPNLEELLTNIGVAAQQAMTARTATPEVREPLFTALKALDDAVKAADAAA